MRCPGHEVSRAVAALFGEKKISSPVAIVACVALVLGSVLPVQAQQALLPINSLIPNPPLVYVGTPAPGTTTITLVANVAPVSAMIPGSVNLSQVTSSGSLVRLIGPMYDDGPAGGHGDSIAGDNNFT